MGNFSIETRGNESSGVGGWLAFLIAGMMFLGPFLNIAIIKGKLLTLEERYPGLASSTQWDDYKTVEWIAIFIFWAISFYGGLGLMTKKTPDAVTRAKLVLWFNYPICIIVTGIIIPTVIIRDSGSGIEDVLGYNIGAAIPGFIASLIGLWIWTAYLNKSKRVHNTYGLGATDKHDVDHATVGGSQQTIQSAPPVNKPVEIARTLPVSTVIEEPAREPIVENIEDWAYEQVGKEFDSSNPDQGAWTKAFAQAGGDDKQTRVLYIKARVEKLIAAEQARLEEIRKAQKEANCIAEAELVNRVSRRKKIASGQASEEINRIDSRVRSDFMNKIAWCELKELVAMMERDPYLVAVSNSEGDTALHIATREMNGSLIRALVDRGANPRAANSAGKTPISIARSKGLEGMAKWMESLSK